MSEDFQREARRHKGFEPVLRELSEVKTASDGNTVVVSGRFSAEAVRGLFDAWAEEATMWSPFKVVISLPSTNTGALGSSKVPGNEMPMLACLDSPGPLTTQPITATLSSSMPGYLSFQTGMLVRR